MQQRAIHNLYLFVSYLRLSTLEMYWNAYILTYIINFLVARPDSK